MVAFGQGHSAFILVLTTVTQDRSTPHLFGIALVLSLAVTLVLLIPPIRRRLGPRFRNKALAVAICATLVFWGGFSSSQSRWNREKAFSGHMSQFYNRSLHSSPTAAQQANPYIAGKIIVVGDKDDTIDGFFWSLPAELRAKTPDEVGTVISKPPCVKGLVGRYTNEVTGGNDGNAYRWHCSLTIIDYRSGVTVGEKEFDGSDPPGKAQHGDQYGDKPRTGDIVTWITSLPRK